MEVLSYQGLSFIFGILGNIISFFVFLAPLPTFYKVCKRKSSAGYASLPYIIALFSASLLLYYGVLKTRAYLLIAINAIGGAIELAYLAVYITYASKRSKIFTMCLILLLDIGLLGVILVSSLTLVRGSKRVKMVGWVCAAINIAVFAAPLSIMRKVLITRSVEFMPITLSIFLTLNATMWFFYGFFVRDYYIAIPNVLGFLLGVVQILLYLIYRSPKSVNVNFDGKEEGNEEIRAVVMTNNAGVALGAKVEAEKDVEMGK